MLMFANAAGVVFYTKGTKETTEEKHVALKPGFFRILPHCGLESVPLDGEVIRPAVNDYFHY